MKRLTVQFTDEQWRLIDELGMANNDSEKVRAIVNAWLCEKSLISTQFKNRKGGNLK
jgi:hypothetical protein